MEFKTCEGLLFRYYDNISLMERYKTECDTLQGHVKDIERSLATMDYKAHELADENMGIDYSRDTISGSGGISRPTEDLIMLQHSRLERELKHCKQQLSRKEYQLREIERQITPVKFELEQLEEDHQEFVLLRYRRKIPTYKISEYLNASQKTCARIRDRVIRELAKKF